MIYILSKDFNKCLCCNKIVYISYKDNYNELLNYNCNNCGSNVYYSYLNNNKILINSYTLNLSYFNINFIVVYVSLFEEMIIFINRKNINGFKIKLMEFNIKNIIKLCLKQYKKSCLL